MTSSRARVLFVNGPCRRVHEAAHLVELSRPLLRTAAQLRAELEVRTPDAIQLATAIHGGCSMLVTNDRRLPEIPGLAVRQIPGLSPLLLSRPGSTRPPKGWAPALRGGRSGATPAGVAAISSLL